MSQLFTNDVHSRTAFSGWERRWTYLLFLLSIACSFCTGCQSFQKRTTERSAQCGALCARAREACEQGKSDQANQYINEAIRQKTSDLETRRQLAEAMWNNRRQPEAVAEFSALCSQQPKDPKLWARLSVMQWDTNQHASAANTAASVLKLDPNSKEAWLVKGRYEVEQGKLDDALVSYIRLSQVAPDDLSTLIELGELHLKRGHPDRACPLFRTAIQHPRITSNQRAEVEWSLGVAYARCERWSVAVSALESAITRPTASAEDWCFLSTARLHCGDLSGAQSDLQQALKRDPQSVAVQKLARRLDTSADFDPSIGRDVVTPASHEESLGIK